MCDEGVLGMRLRRIVDLDARTFERSTPDDARPEILADELTWHLDGATAPFVIDLASYFATVLQT